jgi:hypothetical protein
MLRITLAISLALATGAAAAATPTPTTGASSPSGERDARHAQWRAEAQARFNAADADRDGSLDRVEAQALGARVAEHFDRIDADSNGGLTPEEMKNARKGSRRGHGRAAFFMGLVKGMDDDADGAISRAELGGKMPLWSENFTTIDADGDGRLSHEELREHARATRGGHRGEGERRRHRDDKPKS